MQFLCSCGCVGWSGCEMVETGLKCFQWIVKDTMVSILMHIVYCSFIGVNLFLLSNLHTVIGAMLSTWNFSCFHHYPLGSLHIVDIFHWTMRLYWTYGSWETTNTPQKPGVTLLIGYVCRMTITAADNQSVIHAAEQTWIVVTGWIPWRCLSKMLLGQFGVTCLPFPNTMTYCWWFRNPANRLTPVETVGI